MKISSLRPFLSQSEAAILVILANKLMHSTEACIRDIRNGSVQPLREEAHDAMEVAYALKCTGEQSILENDGMLHEHVNNMLHLVDGWIDLDYIDDMTFTRKEGNMGDRMTMGMTPKDDQPTDEQRAQARDYSKDHQ